MPNPISLAPESYVEDPPSNDPYDDDPYDEGEYLDSEDDNVIEGPSEAAYDTPLFDASNLPQRMLAGPRTASRVHRNLKIARMLMDGMSIAEVGDIMNLSRATVYRAMRTDEGVRHLVDTTARAMASMLPRVKQNYETLLESEDEKIKLEASRDVLKNVGIAPTSTPNTIITNITQNNTVVADSRAMNILREALRPKTLIDITPKPKTK